MNNKSSETFYEDCGTVNSDLLNLFELPGLVFGPIVLRSTWWGFEVISLALEEMTNKTMKTKMLLILTQTFRTQWRNSITSVVLLINQREPILHIMIHNLVWSDLIWSNTVTYLGPSNSFCIRHSCIQFRIIYFVTFS